MGGALNREHLLRENAAGWARLALVNVEREFPADVHHVMTRPGDFPDRPRARNPAFYGSFDWHSCVEMHWLLVRPLRTAGDVVPREEILVALDAHLATEPLAAEAESLRDPANAARQRPYGWGWALALAHEVAVCEEPAARGWEQALEPLAEVVVDAFAAWLGGSPIPVRYGVHSNSAFGLSRALPFAAARDPALHDAIREAARRWFGDDAEAPVALEPSGHDFLSPALVEAELVAALLPRDEFSDWLAAFLPGLGAGEPASFLEPVPVKNSSDPYTAHLHGLNASRAWCWRRIAEALPQGDARVAIAKAACERHAAAALPHVAGDDYMVEHWLAAYAVLLLT